MRQRPPSLRKRDMRGAIAAGPSRLRRRPKERYLAKDVWFGGTCEGPALMHTRRLVVLSTAAILVMALSATADARAKKKQTPYRGDPTISLDGRNTGRARTCGFDTFVYDGLGVPVGPYCH
jgi:hypothetical protein